jgi:hypothetical protein
MVVVGRTDRVGQTESAAGGRRHGRGRHTPIEAPRLTRKAARMLALECNTSRRFQRRNNEREPYEMATISRGHAKPSDAARHKPCDWQGERERERRGFDPRRHRIEIRA